MAKKKATSKKTRKVTKSAADGRFKSKDYAKAHPKTTYEQTVKRRRKAQEVKPAPRHHRT